MGMLITILSISLCLCPLFVLLKFLHKAWWTPIRMQDMMGKQGIKGPPYRFIHGNTKEIHNMRKESISRPMEISHHIFPRVQPHLYSWIKLYGKNFLIWNGTDPQLVVTDTEIIKEVLNNKDGTYPKAAAPFFVKKLFGDGIATTDGEKWVKLRKLANHTFHGESFKGMIPEMFTSAEMMLERWKHHEGKELEIFEEFRQMTSEVISRTAFGRSYSEGKNIFEMLFKLTVLSSRNSSKTSLFPAISSFLKSADYIEAEKLEKEIQDSVIQMIKKREEKVMKGEADSFGSDFLGLLLKANHDGDENTRISLEEMIDECRTFYIAGQETTNTTLAWTVFLLAVHTDWQEKAREEVLKLFGKQVPNVDGLARLKIVTMVIHEALRLYPPGIGFTREVTKEVRFGNVILPANLNVFISTLAVHHDPTVWGEDAHIFKPERFSEGVAKATNNNLAAFLPLGLGPRNCVGSNFGLTEAKIVLSMILQHYVFTLSPAYIHSPFQLLTTRPQNGIQIILRAL